MWVAVSMGDDKAGNVASETILHVLCRVPGARGAALESVAAGECREPVAKVSTNVFVRDLNFADFDRVGRWRRLLMGRPSLDGPKLQSTQRWCRLHAEMGAPLVTRHAEAESLCATHADARSERTENSQAGPDSSFLQQRWVGGGLTKP